jgi:hypothetical protein
VIAEGRETEGLSGAYVTTRFHFDGVIMLGVERIETIIGMPALDTPV